MPLTARSPLRTPIALLAILLPITLSTTGASARSQAQLVGQELALRGWSCADLGRDAGLECRGTVSGYPEPVRAYFPAAFEASCGLDLALHLHGFNLGSSAHERHFAQGRGNFARFLTSSGRTRTIAIAPESTGDGATYDAHLRAPIGAARFLDTVSTALREAGASESDEVDRFTISVHSGADSIVANWSATLPEQPGASAHPLFARYLSRLEALGFFDSVYGLHGRDRIAQYVLARGGTVASFYFGGQRNSPFNDWLRTSLASRSSGGSVRFSQEALGAGEALLERHFAMLSERDRYSRFLALAREKDTDRPHACARSQGETNASLGTLKDR